MKTETNELTLDDANMLLGHALILDLTTGQVDMPEALVDLAARIAMHAGDGRDADVMRRAWESHKKSRAANPSSCRVGSSG